MALTDNLIAYWKMENTSDSLGIYNLTASGSPGSAAGIIGNGRTYVAGTSKDAIAHTSAIPQGSISFWINLTNGAGGRAISKTQAGVSDVFVCRAYASGMSVQIHDSANLNTSGAAISAGVWYHYVITWNGSNVITYRNGSVETNTTSTNTVQANVRSYFFGGTDVNAEGINGILDEIGLWSRALTSGEVTSLYNGGAGFQYPFSLISPNRGFFNLVR